MLKSNELRDMTIDELQLALDDLNEKLFVLVNEMRHTKKSEKKHLVPQMKKEKARMLTILAQKQQLQVNPN